MFLFALGKFIGRVLKAYFPPSQIKHPVLAGLTVGLALGLILFHLNDHSATFWAGLFVTPIIQHYLRIR